MLLKEEADKIMGLAGKVRGVAFKTDAEYVKMYKGIEALKKVEEELAKLGYPFEYEKVNATDWLPYGLRSLSLLAIKQVLGMSNDEVKAMGGNAPKYSFIIKTVLKYFIGIEQIVRFTPRYWKRHVNLGELQVPEFSVKEKYVIVRLVGIFIPAIFAKYLEGYLSRIIQYVLPREEVKCEQLKYSSMGAPYDEYRIFW
jgi:hypothetical protein